MNSLRRLLRPPLTDRGQGLAEYALILGLIATVAVLALMFLSSGVNGLLSTVGESV